MDNNYNSSNAFFTKEKLFWHLIYSLCTIGILASILTAYAAYHSIVLGKTVVAFGNFESYQDYELPKTKK